MYRGQDDLLCAGTPAGLAKLQQIASVVSVKQWLYDSFSYCGRAIKQSPDYTIEVSMHEYAQGLKLLTVSRERRANPSSHARRQRHETTAGWWARSPGPPTSAGST